MYSSYTAALGNVHVYGVLNVVFQIFTLKNPTMYHNYPRTTQYGDILYGDTYRMARCLPIHTPSFHWGPPGENESQLERPWSGSAFVQLSLVQVLILDWWPLSVLEAPHSGQRLSTQLRVYSKSPGRVQAVSCRPCIFFRFWFSHQHKTKIKT